MPKPDLSISALGIELRPLGKKDLPLLCHWRNQPEILPYMDKPRKTSIANLVFWYEKIIRNKNAIPWLAYYHDNPVAYTELTEINQVDKSCGEFQLYNGFMRCGSSLVDQRILLSEPQSGQPCGFKSFREALGERPFSLKTLQS